MPPPITAIHYRWSELPADHPMDLLERRRIIGTQAMISRVILKKGCVVPLHVHPNEQFACILSGQLRFTIGSDHDPARHVVSVGPGEVLHLPSNVPHAAETVEDSVVLDIFSPPSAKTGIDRK